MNINNFAIIDFEQNKNNNQELYHDAIYRYVLKHYETKGTHNNKTKIVHISIIKLISTFHITHSVSTL